MGSHSSKAAKGDVMAQEAAAGDAGPPAKSNGQENGHVKINGDVSPQADGEVNSPNGSKEPAKAEAGSGDAIEPAPVSEGEAKPDSTAAAKETPKKKKKFSFKKSFKLSGISFRKAKKESGDTSAASSPSEEQGQAAEVAGEENQPCAAGPGDQVQAAKEESPAEEETVVPGPAPEAQQEAKREEGKEEEQGEGQLPSGGRQGSPKPAEEAPPSAEPELCAAPAEQKE